MKNIAIILLSFLCIGCSSTKIISKKTPKKVRKLIITSPVFEKAFTGFSLFDPLKKKPLVSVNGNKYFTPASNTKILTLYTALKIMGDTLPAFQYIAQNDSIIILATGDPTFLHTYFNNKKLLTFLEKSADKKLLYLLPKFNEKRLGPGWAWDDYNAYYQVEKAALPMYGNTVFFKGNSKEIAHPSYFSKYITTTKDKYETPNIKRSLYHNNFTVNTSFLAKNNTKEVPFIYSDSLALQLLNNHHNIKIEAISDYKFDLKALKTVYQTPRDTVLKRMMYVSDNFLAEQLLLMSSYKHYKEFNSKKIIQYTKDSLLTKSPQALLWRDGSGLSRYNLLTPNSLVYVLSEIRNITGNKQLLELFPNGSSKGLKNHYQNLGNALHAKTGTLSNRHCLSGYLQCKSGQFLIFSFMHNNYAGSSAPIKKEMAKILTYIINHY